MLSLQNSVLLKYVSAYCWRFVSKNEIDERKHNEAGVCYDVNSATLLLMKYKSCHGLHI